MWGKKKQQYTGHWHPYEYLDTRASQLGTGVSDLSLLRPNTLIPRGFAGPRYNVKNTSAFAGPRPSFVKVAQEFYPISVLGNGFGFYDGINGQALINPAPRIKQG